MGESPGNVTAKPCPMARLAIDCGEDRLGPEDRAAFERHARYCATCRAMYESAHELAAVS